MSVELIRAGVVSFLNARPLIEGLTARDDWRLTLAVPSALPALLDAGEVDVALLPLVEFHRRRDRLRIVSDACIASDGETLTVRVFSTTPPEAITQLHVDGDSRTSVVLARLIWQQLYKRQLDITPLSPDAAPAAACLLIGDKVVTRRPLGFGFEVDLGAAWKHLTGLPMVFAVWACRADLPLATVHGISETLNAARDAGVASAEAIAHRAAAAHHWPEPLARHYLITSLCFQLSERFVAGMNRFLQWADDLDLIERHALDRSQQ